MSYIRQSGVQIALLILSLVGLVIAIYLTIVHYNTTVQLYCSNSGLINCERVTSSAFSYVPGTNQTLPITIPGMLWCLVVALLSFLAWRVWPERRLLPIALVIVTGLGLLSVFYLVYAEIVVLHAICAWCTGFHVLTFLMFLLSIVLFSQSRNEDEELEDEVIEIFSSSVSKNK